MTVNSEHFDRTRLVYPALYGRCDHPKPIWQEAEANM